jgi:hypothetical protein
VDLDLFVTHENFHPTDAYEAMQNTDVAYDLKSSVRCVRWSSPAAE